MNGQERLEHRLGLKQGWRSTLPKNGLILIGILIGSIGVAIAVLSFLAHELLLDAVAMCIPMASCIGSPGVASIFSEEQQASDLSGFLTALSGSVVIGGFILAFNIWRVNSREWPFLGLQALTKLLENWQSHGTITKQQFNEMIADLTR